MGRGLQRRSQGGRYAAGWGVVLAGVILGAGLLGGVASAAGVPSEIRPDFGPGFTVSVTARPASGTNPLLVEFAATVSSGAPTSVAWDFGDGSTASGTWATYAAPIHTFDTPGLYTVSATVSEASGTATGTVEERVQAAPIHAGFAISRDTGRAPLVVTFEGLPSGGTGTYDQLTWAFGDGTTGNGIECVHNYTTAGDFRVTFRVVDDLGASNESSQWVNVSALATPTSGGFDPIWVVPPSVAIAAGVLFFVAGRWLGGPRRSRTGPDEIPPGAALPGRSPRGTLLLDGRLPELPLPGPTPAPEPAAQDPRSDLAAGPASLPLASPPAAVAAPSAAGPTATVPLAPGTAAEGPRQVTAEVLQHLYRLGRLGPYDVATSAWTQAGMVDRLRVPQNGLSNVLRRLVAAEIVTEELRHVKDRPRRVKVYLLSARGEAVARELLEKSGDHRRSGDPGAPVPASRGRVLPRSDQRSGAGR